MSEIDFEFCELPLIVEGGFDAALINGVATIKYQPDGEWSVDEIALDGYKDSGITGSISGRLYERKPVPLCRDSYPWLYATIIDRLENGAFKDAVENSVALALEADGVRRVDPNAEHLIRSAS